MRLRRKKSGSCLDIETLEKKSLGLVMALRLREKNLGLVSILRLRRKKSPSRLIIETSGNKVSVPNPKIWSRYSLNPATIEIVGTEVIAGTIFGEVYLSVVYIKTFSSFSN